MVIGTICHLVAAGTEMESFSKKSQRLVLLVWQDGEAGFVYPLSTHRSLESGPKIVRRQGETSWIVTQRGLFRVPLAALTETEERWEGIATLRRKIEADLDARERRALEEAKKQLTHQPLQDLADLRKTLTPPPKPPLPKPTVKSDKDLFEEYMERDVHRDVRRRGKEGKD